MSTGTVATDPAGNAVAGPPQTPGPRGAAVRFLIAVTASFYGDWLTTVGLVILLYQSTQSPAAPAAYIVARVMPRLLGPTPGGALADRFSPSRVIAACSLAQALLTGSIIVSARLHLIWTIYAAVACAQLIGAAAKPGYAALIPHLTDKEHIGRVNGIYNGVLASSVFVAPAIGAPLLVIFGVIPLIAIDTASFIIAAVLMLTLPSQRVVASATDGRRGVTLGFRMVRADPVLRSMAMSYFSSAAVVTAVQAVLVLAATQRLGSQTDVGWLYSAVGAGGLVGTAVVLHWRPAQFGRPAIIATGLAQVIPLGIFSLVDQLWLALGLLMLSSVGGSMSETWGMTEMQRRVSIDALGRVSAAIVFAMYSGMSMGALAALALVNPLGWDHALQTICVLALLSLVLGVIGGNAVAPAASAAAPAASAAAPESALRQRTR